MSVVQGWVTKDPPALPIVAVIPRDYNERGYEIDRNEGDRRQSYRIEVFANSVDDSALICSLLK